jgi:hypothetical protein
LRKILYIFFIALLSKAVNGQENLHPEHFIQFSGLILTADSFTPIPYASVRIRGTYRGTSANMQGFFSIVVREDDKIEFSSMGFKKKIVSIQPGPDESKYILAVILEADTIVLKTINIYPWPSKSKFKEAFVSIEPNKTYHEVLKENMDQNLMTMLAANVKMDGKSNQNIYLNQMAMNASYKGIANYADFGSGVLIPMSLLDPMAWYRLIQDIKAGKFKKKKQY